MASRSVWRETSRGNCDRLCWSVYSRQFQSDHVTFITTIHSELSNTRLAIILVSVHVAFLDLFFLWLCKLESIHEHFKFKSYNSSEI